MILLKIIDFFSCCLNIYFNVYFNYSVYSVVYLPQTNFYKFLRFSQTKTKFLNFNLLSIWTNRFSSALNIRLFPKILFERVLNCLISPFSNFRSISEIRTNWADFGSIQSYLAPRSKNNSRSFKPEALGCSF